MVLLERERHNFYHIIIRIYHDWLFGPLITFQKNLSFFPKRTIFCSSKTKEDSNPYLITIYVVELVSLGKMYKRLWGHYFSECVKSTATYTFLHYCIDCSI